MAYTVLAKALCSQQMRDLMFVKFSQKVKLSENCGVNLIIKSSFRSKMKNVVYVVAGHPG